MRVARMFLILLIVTPVFADSLETTAPVAVISPWTYWPNLPRSGRFYRPTGVKVGCLTSGPIGYLSSRL